MWKMDKRKVEFAKMVQLKQTDCIIMLLEYYRLYEKFYRELSPQEKTELASLYKEDQQFKVMIERIGELENDLRETL